MGKRNYLIEGVSGTGKSSVWQELRRRGYVAINGDRELAYLGYHLAFFPSSPKSVRERAIHPPSLNHQEKWCHEYSWHHTNC